MQYDEMIAPQVAAAHGVTLVMGDNPNNLALFAGSPMVDRVIAVSQSFRLMDDAHALLKQEHYDKIELVDMSAYRVKHRDVDYVQIDYLFADLWEDVWGIGRIDTMQDFQREFRPKRAGHRWQELDIAATWIASGKPLAFLNNPVAIDMFRLETMIMIDPRTQSYAERCRDVASDIIETAKAKQKKAAS